MICQEGVFCRLNSGRACVLGQACFQPTWCLGISDCVCQSWQCDVTPLASQLCACVYLRIHIQVLTAENRVIKYQATSLLPRIGPLRDMLAR